MAVINKPKPGSFVQSANSDLRVKRLKRMLKQGRFKVDLDAYYAELDMLHGSRLVRRIKTREVLTNPQGQIIEAVLQNQAYRSRIVEMKKHCWRISAQLEEATTKLRKYLQWRYADEFAVYRNSDAREAALSSVMERANSQQSKLNSFIEFADLVIEDVDKAGYSLKNLIDVMSLNATKGAEI